MNKVLAGLGLTGVGGISGYVALGIKGALIGSGTGAVLAGLGMLLFRKKSVTRVAAVSSPNILSKPVTMLKGLSLPKILSPMAASKASGVWGANKAKSNAAHTAAGVAQMQQATQQLNAAVAMFNPRAATSGATASAGGSAELGAGVTISG